jgi:hypothetical protein
MGRGEMKVYLAGPMRGTRLEAGTQMATRRHRELCNCGGYDHHVHGPITPEHAAWCRRLATKSIGPRRTMLTDEHEKCAKAFPGFVLPVTVPHIAYRDTRNGGRTL